MNKICTSIEQSKRLIELGIDVNTADMRYGYIAPYEYSDRMFDGGYDEVPYPKDFLKKNQNFSENDYDGEFPAWSLSALLYLLDNPQLFNYDDNWKCDGYTCLGYPHNNAIDAVFEVVEIEAEKFQKGAKRHGIRRSIIRNK